MEVIIFLLFAALALASALVVILHPNAVYSTMSLVVTLVSLAALFVLLGAPFIAALQVLIYTGAILVLFLFVIMLLNVGEEAPPLPSLSSPQTIGAGLVAVLFGGALAFFTYEGLRTREVGPLTEEFVNLKSLALLLFGEYLLAFELVGVLLLVAVIAATVLARKPGVSRTTAETAAARERLDAADAADHQDGDLVEEPGTRWGAV